MDTKSHITEFEEAGPNKNSILIVDDDRLITLALTQILSPEYIVYTANDGHDALKVAKEMKPDLILLDVLMSGMSGFDTIVVLKSMIETRNIPVIFITGLDNHKDEEKGLLLGAADYINKPFTPAIVRLRVNNQIKIINQLRIIQHLSVTDTLTNTANRRQFNAWLDAEWKRAARLQVPLSILMVDIDHFKAFNDNHGHLQGDIALKAVAESIKKKLKRPRDLVARWGGEEFAVVLPDTNTQGAFMVAEDIRTSIAEEAVLHKEGESVHVTVSIGTNSIIPGPEHSIDRFLHDVDEALYKAKQAGRNCTFCAIQ